MPHSDMKNAVRRIARTFEVSYQHAWTRILRAIHLGQISSIDVVRGKVDIVILSACGTRRSRELHLIESGFKSVSPDLSFGARPVIAMVISALPPGPAGTTGNQAQHWEPFEVHWATHQPQAGDWLTG